MTANPHGVMSIALSRDAPARVGRGRTLLAMDAWSGTATAAPGAARALAIMLAAGVELPPAGRCAALAARSFTQRGAVIDNPVNSARQSLDGSTPDG